MIKIKSPEDKKILVQHMSQTPEESKLLDTMKLFGQVFGKMEWIGYEGSRENELRAKLEGQ